MRSAHLVRLSFGLATSLALTACLGDSGGSGGTAASTGYLSYNGLSGLSYQTASQTGTTDSSGRFLYYPGETLSFNIGDLALAEGVPAREYVTPLEFFSDVRAALNNAGVDGEGLSTHTITEQQLLHDATLSNFTRFLMSLNWTENVKDGEGMDIRDRVIQQINAALPKLSGPIDFAVPEPEFTATGTAPSPANQLLAAICFYPEGDELCEAPPTQDEIDNAPGKPEEEADWDPDIDYSEDLQAKRDRILDSVRTLDVIDEEDARIYLTRELNAISTNLANRYYLENHVASHPASDTGIKSLEIHEIGKVLALSDLEAISTRPSDVVIHATDWQSGRVEYFVDGESGGESELILSFRPEGTYRWVRKQLRVIIR
ncbi:organic solvent ABC transporter permease [Marinobacter salinexigens]|uniref:Organic solvent ABC transporter permease n=1 Tax=Marinobacter salinexigens TaxID=2919747 RepID=A0A5B0VGZ2_9GAMM|nr:organic solvent ABC transporter permease [Marinobacter salinexigens]KAA1173852.1 organic solvent ABC transporter permease [Marinobacter salinexigens]